MRHWLSGCTYMFVFVIGMWSMFALGHNSGMGERARHENESGIFVEFHRGVIAPYGMTPYVDIHNNWYWTRIYRTGEVYEVIDRSPEIPELHRLNYWVKTHN